jgi:hypothetical protein
MSVDVSTNPSAAFANESSKDERIAVLKNDVAQQQPIPTRGSTYHSRAQSEIGQELGRFAYLTRGQQTVVGSTANPPYPVQPHPFAIDAGQEPAFPVDISATKDLTKV